MSEQPSNGMKKIGLGIAAAVILVLIITQLRGGFSSSGPETTAARELYHTVALQDLKVSVTESGNINALNSHDIKSEVEGQTTIISIIEEGTYLTAEDVEKGTILVELDASRITENLTEREITFSSAEAKYTEAREGYEIQIKQNESDINAAKLKLRFGLMDLQKYLGEKLGTQLVDKDQGHSELSLFIATLVSHEKLGGEASQKKRELEAAISLADEQLLRGQSTLAWTKKLFEQEYASKSEVEGDEFQVTTRQIDLDKAKTSLELYRRYEFPKETEKLLSDYREAGHELERTQAKARSEEAQSLAKRNSAHATYKLQKDKLEKLRKQLDACVIRTPGEGLVVYGRRSRGWGRNETIELGSEVRERQKIIEIPDTSVMAVEIQVHESWVDKVQAGQRANVTMDAFPDARMMGTVLSVAPLPDSQSSWLDTGVKAYKTEVRIDGTYDFLRPGMSAKVEIIINELSDILCLPLQAVATQKGKKFCYVIEGSESKPVEIETGDFNDNYIEVTQGLSAGQKILLVPPRLFETAGNN